MKGEMTKQDFINSLNWQGRTSRRFSKCDVSVTLGADKKINITFRNDTWEIISSTGHAQVAVCKNRILFREANESEGYKFTRSGNTPSRYIFVNSTADSEFIGDYDLQYDDFLELYYIDKEKKQ